MIRLFLPVVLVVVSNVFYNLCTKLTPQKINPFLSLAVTYIVAATVSFASFLITGKGRTISGEFSKLNWASLILGISIVGLELGYIYMYRAGWKMSVGSLVANIALACVLLFVGMWMFKEQVSFKQIIGVILCFGGLFLITK